MKSKNYSLRFEEYDLELAYKKSGFDKPQRLFDFLLSEYVKELKRSPATFYDASFNIKKATVVSDNGKKSVRATTEEKPPERMIGESSIDYQLRRAEWCEKINKH